MNPGAVRARPQRRRELSPHPAQVIVPVFAIGPGPAKVIKVERRPAQTQGCFVCSPGDLPQKPHRALPAVSRASRATRADMPGAPSRSRMRLNSSRCSSRRAGFIKSLMAQSANRGPVGSSRTNSGTISLSAIRLGSPANLDRTSSKPICLLSLETL